MISKDMSPEEKERLLSLYFKTNTPTFLKVKYEDSYRVLNGYLKDISNPVIIDDVVYGDYPVEKQDIIKVDVSKKSQLNTKRIKNE